MENENILYFLELILDYSKVLFEDNGIGMREQ